jgi:hypothetical protein
VMTYNNNNEWWHTPTIQFVIVATAAVEERNCGDLFGGGGRERWRLRWFLNIKNIYSYNIFRLIAYATLLLLLLPLYSCYCRTHPLSCTPPLCLIVV